MLIWLSLNWKALRWMMVLHGRSDYFYAKRWPEQKIIGIRTGCRRAGESEVAVVNPMIECLCDRIVKSRQGLMEKIQTNGKEQERK